MPHKGLIGLAVVLIAVAIASRWVLKPKRGLLEAAFDRFGETELNSAPQLLQEALWRCNYPDIDTFSNYTMSALQALTHAIKVDKPKLTKLERWVVKETVLHVLCTQLALTRFKRYQPRIFTRMQVNALVTTNSKEEAKHELCLHPNATCLTLAEALDPIAPAAIGPWFVLSALDIRIWKARAAIWLLDQFKPSSVPANITTNLQPSTPVDETALRTIFLGSPVYFTALSLPTYEKWFNETDHTEVGREVQKLLQLIQFQRGGKELVWVLNSPDSHATRSAANSASFVEWLHKT